MSSCYQYFVDTGMNRKAAWAMFSVCLLFSTIVSSSFKTDVLTNPERVDGWAVLLEMNEFPEGWSDLPVEFINSERMREALLSFGWQSDHILTVLDNLTASVVQEVVEWLVNRADLNDIALLYIFTHGGWMSRALQWNDWFPMEWEKLATSKKILMIDTCYADAFAEPTRSDPESHVSLACCSADEVSWAGIEEEGLPIIGSVWNYYFTNALHNSSADFDNDRFVSIEEAFDFSKPSVQDYMKETVFTVPEFLQQYHGIGIFPEDYDAYPHPVIDDQYLGQLFLDLSYYNLSSDLNSDGAVNIMDITIVAKAFGTEEGDENYNPIADVDSSKKINILDISIVAKDFGKKHQEIAIALYSDTGVWEESVAAAQKMLQWIGYTATLVNADYINYKGLDEFTVLCVPGGDMYQYSQDISSTGLENIRNFVRNGGGYVGICGGAYFAGEKVVWRGATLPITLLAMFPGTAEGPINEITPYPNYSMCKVNIADCSHPIVKSEQSSVWTLYYWGPALKPNEDVNVSVLGRYDVGGQPAMVAFDYGLGRVFLVGTHPEIEEDSERDGVSFADEFDDEGSDWELMMKAVYWVIKIEI